MDNYQAIAGGFQEIIELVSVSVDGLAQPIALASELCTGALLQERKIISGGIGAGLPVAQLFSHNLLHHFEQERPALPAMTLSVDALARQVRALGQPGDVLLLVATGEGNSSLIQAVQAAHDREMGVVILTGPEAADVSRLLLPEDVELHVATPRIPRLVEMYSMIIHCLCEQIERALFGNYEL